MGQIQYFQPLHQQVVAAVQKQILVVMLHPVAQVVVAVPDHVHTEAAQEILHQ
jgi:hypothetical protein